MATSVGKILILPKGNYDASTQYEQLDLVRYNGKTWLCKQSSKGNIPAEGTYWMEMCSDGADGHNGTDGEDGTNAYIHIRYSAAADGTGFIETPTAATKYIGIYDGTSATAPTDKAAYMWSKYVGESGTGSGDMLKSVYDTDDDGKVDAAEDADKLGGQPPSYYQTALDDATETTAGKMSPEDKTKLNGIADNANNYSLPTASSSEKGGAKISGTDGLTMDGDTLKAAVKGLIDSQEDFDAQTVSTLQAVDSFALKEILDGMKGIALTGTLTASATSITITDAAIVTGNTVKYDYYTDVYGVSPTAASITTGSMTLTFAAQTVDVAVRVEIREV